MDTKDIIKQKRLEKNLTMKKLGEFVGVSEATISRWESGNIATMKQTKIGKLCEALNISPNEIVPGIEPLPPSYHAVPSAGMVKIPILVAKFANVTFFLTHSARNSKAFANIHSPFLHYCKQSYVIFLRSCKFIILAFLQVVNTFLQVFL